MFPTHLHRMLQDAERKGFEHIVCWVDETHFRVNDRADFEKVVLPLYFESTKFKSFRRQLNFYRFECVRVNSQGLKGCYTHPHFRRSDFNLEAMLYSRQQLKGRRKHWATDLTPYTYPTDEQRQSTPSRGPSRPVTVSPSSSHTDGLHLYHGQHQGVDLFNIRHDDMSWPIQLKKEIRQEEDPWPRTNEISLEPLVDDLFANWQASVPRDIQDEIVATFVNIHKTSSS